MPVPSTLGQLSQTASMNSPAGGENVFPDQDDYERQQFANDAILRDGAHQWLTGVSGTNTVTGSTAAASAVSAYAAGQAFRFVAAGENTGAVTLNVNGLGAKAVTKRGATALAAGDIASGAVVNVVYDGTQFQVVASESADLVRTSGNQTVAGVKTFTSAPKSSVAAAASDELVRKQEMDAAVALRALLAGSASQAFEAADGATGKQVINISQFTKGPAFCRRPDGLLEQWGYVSIGDIGDSADGSVTFPLAFPTACRHVSLTPRTEGGQLRANFTVSVVNEPLRSGFSYTAREFNNDVTHGVGFFWRAIGD